MRTRAVFQVAALAVVSVGCEVIAPPPALDVVRGEIYTELHGGPPCEAELAPRELVGIGLRFRDPAGVALASTRTQRLTATALPPEQVGGGGDVVCRFSGHYEVTLPVRPSYTIDFDVPDPPERGGYFSGTDQLTTQTISRADLEEQGFTWSFGLPPSWVVP